MILHPVFELVKVSAFMLSVEIWTFPGFRRVIHNYKKRRHIGCTHEIFSNRLNAMIHMDTILLFCRVQPENCIVVVVAICVLSDEILHGKLHVRGKMIMKPIWIGRKMVWHIILRDNEADERLPRAPQHHPQTFLEYASTMYPMIC